MRKRTFAILEEQHDHLQEWPTHLTPVTGADQVYHDLTQPSTWRGVELTAHLLVVVGHRQHQVDVVLLNELEVLEASSSSTAKYVR